MPALVDLHTHSTASDGGLAPAELVRAAAERGVRCLALTDHDTCAGVAEARAEAARQGVLLIPGIELSTVWAGRGVHVVGLDIDPESPAMVAAVARQQQARAARGEEIARRLARKGFEGVLAKAQAIAGGEIVGRPHFARAMVALGQVTSEGEAFRDWLGNGKLGDVKAHWPEMAEAVAWIRAAGGIAVLAHPGKYDMTWAWLRRLLAAFVEAGGQAMEVSYGGEKPEVICQLVRMARQHGLLGSVGSDFHRFEYQWTDIGKYPPVREPIPVVWEGWLAESLNKERA